MDVDAIDFVGLDDRHAPRHRRADDLVEQALAIGCRQDFRVGDAGDVVIGLEDDGAGHDGAGQAAAPDFVDAGHVHVAQAPDLVLDRPRRPGPTHGIRPAG